MCDEARQPTPAPVGPPTYFTGDPHVRTFSGRNYDFHGGCDLVLLSNPDFNDGQGLHIHVRTKITRWWSSIESAVLQIGEDKLEVKAGVEDRPYWFNGVKGSFDTSQPLPFTIGGFSGRFRQPTETTVQYRIFLGGEDESIIIKSSKSMLRVEMTKPRQQDFGKSLGLMGTYGTGELVGRDGVTIFDDTNEFGQHWQVRDTDPLLFLEPEGPQFPEKCAMPDTTATFARRQLRAHAVSRKDAEDACFEAEEEDFENCVSDVLALDDVTAAAVY